MFAEDTSTEPCMRLRSARLLCGRSLLITALDFELLEGNAKHQKAFAQEISTSGARRSWSAVS